MKLIRFQEMLKVANCTVYLLKVHSQMCCTIALLVSFRKKSENGHHVSSRCGCSTDSIVEFNYWLRWSSVVYSVVSGYLHIEE